MNKRYLIIKKNNKDVFFKNINNYYIEKYYKSSNIIIFAKILNKIIYTLNSKKSHLVELFYSRKWKKIIKKNYIDIVILFDNGFDERIPYYIKRNNSKIKTVLWFWNPIDQYEKKFINCKYIDEFWTFDRTDSKRYNFKFNSQFYSLNEKIKKNTIEYNVLYLGRAKGRYKELKNIEQEFSKYISNNKFIIVENEKDCVDYDDYLKYISKSKCIFDYNQSNQIGLSLRPLEALFFEKKLITNNKDIVNYDFYNPKNIFILGIDDMKNIKEFINSDYEKVDQKIIDYYDFENWIKRFN